MHVKLKKLILMILILSVIGYLLISSTKKTSQLNTEYSSWCYENDLYTPCVNYDNIALSSKWTHLQTQTIYGENWSVSMYVLAIDPRQAINYITTYRDSVSSFRSTNNSTLYMFFDKIKTYAIVEAEENLLASSNIQLFGYDISCPDQTGSSNGGSRCEIELDNVKIILTPDNKGKIYVNCSTKLCTDGVLLYDGELNGGLSLNTIAKKYYNNKAIASATLSYSNIFSCVNPIWSPNPGTICQNTTFVQGDGCGNLINTIGTKSETFLPLPSEKCYGESFVQDGDCGHQKLAIGTKNCACVPTNSGCAANTCIGQTCNDSCSNIPGTKNCTVSYLCSSEIASTYCTNETFINGTVTCPGTKNCNPTNAGNGNVNQNNSSPQNITVTDITACKWYETEKDNTCEMNSLYIFGGIGTVLAGLYYYKKKKKK